MGWPKGKPRGKKTGGRTAGAQNKVPKAAKISAKDRVEEVDAELTQSKKGLAQQAKDDPKWFYEKIWVKILPKVAEISGPDGGPIPTSIEVRFIGIDKQSHS